LYVSYTKAHTQHHRRYQVAKMRRQHLNERTASKHPNPVTEADTYVAFVTDIIEPECKAIVFETKALLARSNSEAVVW
jgi:hypothetical protein